jgi:hypothetical protein
VTRVYFPAVGVGCKQELRFETLPRSIRSIEGKVNLAFVELRHRRDNEVGLLIRIINR